MMPTESRALLKAYLQSNGGITKSTDDDLTVVDID